MSPAQLLHATQIKHSVRMLVFPSNLKFLLLFRVFWGGGRKVLVVAVAIKARKNESLEGRVTKNQQTANKFQQEKKFSKTKATRWSTLGFRVSFLDPTGCRSNCRQFLSSFTLFCEREHRRQIRQHLWEVNNKITWKTFADDDGFKVSRRKLVSCWGIILMEDKNWSWTPFGN